MGTQPNSCAEPKIVIGSRGSKLALWQAGWVRDQLMGRGHEVEIKVVRTSGDRLTAVSLVGSGTKGLFIKEIEEALAAGAIDLAVHSLKDLPTDQPPGLRVGAVPARADARDVLVSRDGRPLAALPPGARVGTGSLRRQSQLHALRADLETVPARGNVDTRLRKLEQGDYDALVLAAAGLDRLGLSGCVAQYFSPDEMCPAVGQGALALEIRQGDERLEQAIRSLDDLATCQAVRAERAMLRRLGGGCQVPIAAHASSVEGGLRLLGVIASLDGSRVIRAAAAGPADDPEALGATVATELLRQGGREILTSMSSEVSDAG